MIATTDHAGTVTARYAYDPFGKRRYTNSTYDSFGNLIVDWTTDTNNGTDRGFTGHEHLDDLGLVHMNGRIYDPTVGRFMQADPFVQDLLNLQNYDRYAYCFNSPLICTDPSGYFSLKKLFRAVLAIVVIYFTYGAAAEYLAFTAQVGSTATIVGASATAGFVGGAISSGTLKGALQGAFSSVLFAGVGQFVGDAGLSAGGAAIDNAEKFAGAIALHGVAGCISSVAGGGKCGPGALSAAFSKAALPFTAGFKDGLERGFVHAIVGGTASVLGGGKFANGALTGAFSYLFNHCAHDPDSCGMGSPESNRQGLANTAGDAAGLKVLGYGLGGVAVVGGGAMAVSYSLAAPVGDAVFYTGWAKYGEGIAFAAAAEGTPIFNTPLGRVMTSIQNSGWGSERLWSRAWDMASAGYAHYAQGTVKVLEWVRNSASTFRRIEWPILQRNGNPIVNVPPPGP